MNKSVWVAEIKKIWNYRELISQLTIRDLMTRYKGSYIGFGWAVLNPLLMLFVYSFIFIVVFHLKWGNGPEVSKATYTLMIFCGLIPFYIFSESVNRSLGIISGSPNYVTKVVFPLETLPISLVASIFITNGISIILLILGKLLFMSTPSWALFFLPVILLPLLFLSIGLALIFSALGVYVRDLTHTIALLINILFYMSPIFYSVSAVPKSFQFFIQLNPLTFIIEQWRNVILLGQIIEWKSYFISLLASILVLIFGFVLFKALRKGFSDVI